MVKMEGVRPEARGSMREHVLAVGLMVLVGLPASLLMYYQSLPPKAPEWNPVRDSPIFQEARAIYDRTNGAIAGAEALQAAFVERHLRAFGDLWESVKQAEEEQGYLARYGVPDPFARLLLPR